MSTDDDKYRATESYRYGGLISPGLAAVYGLGTGTMTIGSNVSTVYMPYPQPKYTTGGTTCRAKKQPVPTVFKNPTVERKPR